MKYIAFIISTVVLLGSLVGVHSAHAFNPYWSMQGSTIAGGSHYSRQTGLAAMHPVSTESVSELSTNGDWSATVSLPLNVSLYYEFADISNVSDSVDVLIKDLGDKDLSLAAVQSLQRDANTILRDFEALDRIINVGVVSNGYWPVIAFTHPLIKGTFTFEHQGGLSALPSNAFAASFTAADLKIDPEVCVNLVKDSISGESNDNVEACVNALTDSQKQTVCGTTSLNSAADYLNCDFTKLGNIFKLSSDATINLRAVTKYDNYIFGYSTEVWQHHNNSNSWITGSLFAGAKLSFTDIETALVQRKLTDLANEDVSDIVDDLVNNDDNSKASSGTGIDGGVTWLNARYMAGLTLNNVIAPKIEYADSTIEQDIMPSFQGSFYLNESKSWSARLQNDFAAMKDLSGAEHQWRVLGLSYTSNSWWIPGLDVSKRWNLAGQELSYTALGFSLFNLLQINVAASDQTSSNIPRSILFSAGFGFSI